MGSDYKLRVVKLTNLLATPGKVQWAIHGPAAINEVNKCTIADQVMKGKVACAVETHWDKRDIQIGNN